MKEGRVVQVWVAQRAEFQPMLERTLNENLAHGWDLVSTITIPHSHDLEAFLVFTRPKQLKPGD